MSWTRRAALTATGSLGALWSLGCSGLRPQPQELAGLDTPPVLDPGASDRRPTTGRVKSLPEGFRRLRSTQDGLERESLLYTPDQGGKRPLLIGIHGNSGSSEWMMGRCGLGAVVRERGWFGLFPECDVWSRSDPRPDHGDARYLSAVLDKVVQGHRVDPSRVWVFGFSGGGMRAYRLAALRSDRVAAIATCAATIGHSGAGHDAWNPVHSDAKPVSILHVHGKKDRTVDPRGGPVEGRPGVSRVAVNDALEVWARHVGAREVKDAKAPGGCPSRVRTRRWETPQSHVIQAVIDPNLDHSWADYMTDAAVRFVLGAPPR